jgi:hypothetical protein
VEPAVLGPPVREIVNQHARLIDRQLLGDGGAQRPVDWRYQNMSCSVLRV